MRWLCLLFVTATFGAQAQTLALTNATLYPVSGPPIVDGVLVVRDGRIAAIGSAIQVSVPEDATVYDLSGKIVIPGLIDTHSHVGIGPRPMVPANQDVNEGTDPVQPNLRALDAIWPQDPGIRMALAGGITTANIMPGSGNVVGGQTAYVKLRGNTVDEMWIRGADGRPVLGGMKMANGENPKRAGSPERAPMTRMAVAYLERKIFIEALDYQKKQSDGAQNGDPLPATDLRLEPMLEVLEGRRIVHHHTHRADDIASVLRIADEFGHRVVLQHATEAYKLADLLAREQVPVSAIVVDAPGGKHEAIGLSLESPGILERAGVKVALHTDDWITHSRLLLRSGALAVRGGMSEPGALAALTQNAADMLDLGDRLGSLDPGKEADFVVLSGLPFATRTRVLETWIEGVRVWDRAVLADRLYQTGGFAIPDRYPAEPR